MGWLGPRRCALAWLGAALFVTATLAACKPHPTRPPRRDVSGMNVEQIERELARNREDLEAAGVFIPPPVDAAPRTESPPALEGGTTPGTGEPAEAAPEGEAPVAGPVDEPIAAAPAEELDTAARDLSVRSRRSRIDRDERRENRTRCERICDLADVTCDLQDQICALADRHAHDVRYQAACERAELQCAAAERECELCD